MQVGVVVSGIRNPGPLSISVTDSKAAAPRRRTYSNYLIQGNSDLIPRATIDALRSVPTAGMPAHAWLGTPPGRAMNGQVAQCRPNRPLPAFANAYAKMAA
jgi:hypothetical protein